MWCDEKEEIKKRLTSLEDLHKLVKARRENPSSSEFVVLGLWRLDKHGQVSQVKKRILVPPVCTVEEYSMLAEASGESDAHWWSMSPHIPHPDIPCAFCGRKWTLDDCWDFLVMDEPEKISLAAFWGESFKAAKQHYAAKRDAIYQVMQEIRNDKHIDLTLKNPHSEKEWERKEVRNKLGWIEKVDDSRVIEEGDEAGAFVIRFYHRKCYKLMHEHDVRADFTRVFKKAGFEYFLIQAIPSGYCDCDYCAPWFEFQTELGKFTIGWRKRVVSINLDVGLNLAELFADENVTKDETCIHAWGYEKVLEYLTKIRQALLCVGVQNAG